MNSTQTRNTDYCKFIESKTNIRLYFLRRIFVLHADICEMAFQHVKVILYGTSFLQYHKSDESFRQLLAISHFMRRWVDMRNVSNANDAKKISFVCFVI